MPVVQVGDLAIAYRREGRGVPMVMIHGITTYSFLWQEMTPFLAAGYDVVALDLLGCGDSAKPLDRDYSIKSQAVLVARFMDSLGIDKAHIVAHDIGGGIAQILAVDAPERVLSLTLVNSVAYDYWPVQPIVSMRIPILRIFAMAALDIGVFRKIVERAFYHREKVDDAMMALFWKPLKSAGGKKGFLRLAKSLDNSQLMEIADRLPLLPMPVLIVRGEADIFLKPVHHERLHREIPGSHFERIVTAGHFSPLDEPEILVGMVRDFIAAGVAVGG